MNLKDLAAPFPASDIEWRVQSSGKKGDRVWARVLAYITNRAIMQRLDDVCGPEHWRNEYRYEAGGAVLCGISIYTRVPVREGQWVTKWDGAENTDIEAVKGGLSNAMKRAAVQWGIGRYLYDLEEGYANVSENGAHYAKLKEGGAFKWDPPALPKWALPSSEPAKVAPRPTTKTAPVAATSTIVPKSDFSPALDEDKIYDGKRLGDYEDGVLAAFNMKVKAAGAKEWVKAIANVRANRVLGTEPKRAPTDDEAVERMKRGVDADAAPLETLFAGKT